MQCLLFPKAICNLIDKPFRNFLWADHLGQNKIHLLNWSSISLSKREGGLGIHKTWEMNQAFLSKLFWRTVTEPSSCWSQICNHRLSFHTCKLSHIGKCLLVGKELAAKGSFRVINSGVDSSFWHDPWSSLGALRSVVAGPLSIDMKMLSLLLICLSLLVFGIGLHAPFPFLLKFLM